MTRADILSKVGRALNKASTLDALTKARLLDHVNNRHRQILSAPGMAGLRRRQFRFTSVAGMSRYSVYNGEKVHHVRDLTNDRELSQRSLNSYRQYNPDPSQTQGTPDGFVQYGFEPVLRQPIDVSPLVFGPPLFVVSTSAADTTQTVYIESLNGATSVLLNGTTAVSVGSAQFLDKFYLSAPCVGVVSLLADSPTGIGLSTILQGQTSALYLALYLDPTPSQALNYEVDADFVISDLAQDTDVPDLPNEFHDLLETGAILDELAHLDDDRLVVMQRTYDRRLGELKLKLARMGTDQGPRGISSRLGPWAPAGRW
jgi:hypothetical protein